MAEDLGLGSGKLCTSWMHTPGVPLEMATLASWIRGTWDIMDGKVGVHLAEKAEGRGKACELK